MKPWGCVGGSRGKPLELPVPWAAGSRRNECVGSYILPWGIPSSSWGPFRLLLSHGPLPSHPSFFAERPTGSCVLPRPRAAGRPGPHLPGQGPPGRVQPPLCLVGRQPALRGLPIPWGTWAAANQRAGRGVGAGVGVPGRKWLTRPLCRPQPWPPATTWTSGTCRTCPSHTLAGILGTASCRLEPGERMPQAPRQPGAVKAAGSMWWDFSGTGARPGGVWEFRNYLGI